MIYIHCEILIVLSLYLYVYQLSFSNVEIHLLFMCVDELPEANIF